MCFCLGCGLGGSRRLAQPCSAQSCSADPCSAPLGMGNRRIRNSQITTSGGRKNITLSDAWCPDIRQGSKTKKNYDQSIQIDLLKVTNITGIATQRRMYSGGLEYLADYKISYKRVGGGWKFYQGKGQTVEVNFIEIKFRMVRAGLQNIVMQV